LISSGIVSASFASSGGLIQIVSFTASNRKQYRVIASKILFKTFDGYVTRSRLRRLRGRRSYVVTSHRRGLEIGRINSI